MTENIKEKVTASDSEAALIVENENSEPQETNITCKAKSGSEKASQASELIALGKESELFRTPSGDLYAKVKVDEHFENWGIDSTGFRSWLAHQYYRAHEIGPSPHAVEEALTTLKAIAQFDGDMHEVFIRVAQQDGMIYLDLANKKWQAVKITDHGWSIVDHSPIKFIRQKGMESLPIPIQGGSIDELRSFVNLKTDDDFKLLVAWTLATLTYGNPYPILILSGEKGCAKSTTTKLLRKLVDPNTALLRQIPKDDRDLAIMSHNSYVVAFDNLSGIAQKVSDMLCRLSTGGATTTRKLYTNDEEMVFQATRPIILNGIGDVGTASDLLDRSVILTLPVIDLYKPEKEIDLAFEEARPRILGAILNVVTHGLKNLPDAKQYRQARMADFATWIGACEPALGWSSDSFIKAYTKNRSEAQQLAIEASPIAEPVRALVTESGDWTGSSGELLEILNSRVSDVVARRYDWPRSPEKLASLLNRIAPDLRKNGIEIHKLENRVGGTGKRQWLLKNVSRGAQVVGSNNDDDPFESL